MSKFELQNPPGHHRYVAKWILLMLLTAFAAAAGCLGRTTTVAEIRNSPAKYLEQEVTVEGDVVDSFKLPLLPGYYIVDDGSGRIAVVTDRLPPLSHSHIRTSGPVQSAITLNGVGIGLHLIEVRRR